MYALNGGTSIQALENRDIVRDALTHMSTILDGCQFRKADQRSGVNQFAYGVAKLFGHRSSYHDIYLHHRSMRDVVGQDPMIPVPEVRSVEMYWRLVILGRGTKQALQGGDILAGGTSTPNEIFCNFTVNGRMLTVVMELTASAFINLCGDLGKTISLARPMATMIRAKWGSLGEAYGVYDPWGARTDEEGYRIVRTVNGLPMTQTIGASWVEGYDNRKAEGWLKPR